LHRGRWRSNDPVEDEPAERLYIGLDDYILKHLGRVGVTSQELYQRVVDDYGPVVERTFYRHLKALRAAQRLTVSVRPMNQGYLYSR
jgi:Fe2+ or Zn2+ uptake regulation protein